MDKTTMMKAALIFFVLSIAVFLFSFRYFHYSKENGLLGREYHKEANKPVVSMLWGILGTDLLCVSIVFFVLGLLNK